MRDSCRQTKKVFLSVTLFMGSLLASASPAQGAAFTGLKNPGSETTGCATFDSASGNLQVPCFSFSGMSYWLELLLKNMELELKGYGNGSIAVTNPNCAYFNYSSNILHLPCFEFNNQNYWLDLELKSAEPVVLALSNYGLNSSTSSFSITHEKSYTLTPSGTNLKGVFCRLFYHPSRNKFYLTLSSGSANDGGYSYIEYDANLNETGVKGPLPINFSGDYAIVSESGSYYFLTGAPSGYLLLKLDSDFNLTAQATISMDMNYNATNDQIMNYADGKLIISSLYDTEGTGSGYKTGLHTGTTYPHLFFYNTSLAQTESSRYLMDESNIPSGGSIIFNNGKYHMVTADKMQQSKLYVYQWDSNWKYLGKKLLSASGQWSQGLIYDNGRYYVAYHSGEHGNGNAVMGVFDGNWDSVASLSVTKYAGNYNAQRPWVLKVSNKVYVSYDVETVAAQEARDWQCHLDKYSITE